MLSVEKLAIPAAAATTDVPDSAPPPGFAWIVAVTSPVKPVAVVASGSRAVTRTAGVITAPPVVLLGWIVITSWLAGPGTIAKAVLVAAVRPAAVAGGS